MIIKHLAAILLLSTAPTILLAQPNVAPGAIAPPPAATQPAAPPGPPTANQQAVEQRIAALQARLGITADQQPAWASFAQAMRDNAASTDQLFSQRAAGAAQMTAIENMHSYAAIARAYADNTEKLSAAFDMLSSKLTDAQKHTADTLFRQAPPVAPAHAPRRRR